MKLQTSEKFAFLKLAHYIANIDGEYEKEEQEIIEEYCAEMGIDNIKPNLDDFNYEDVLQEFHSQKSQKIVLLELLILVHSDDKFHKFEHRAIDKIATFFKISKKDLEIYSQWGKTVSAQYAQGIVFIED
ncbi:MAG: TerB family tellurite resistance protein [Campylobacterales bacterium]|nr:TerB family tellurite resistance protein [Campylobacterales bacterium]